MPSSEQRLEGLLLVLLLLLRLISSVLTLVQHPGAKEGEFHLFVQLLVLFLIALLIFVILFLFSLRLLLIFLFPLLFFEFLLYSLYLCFHLFLLLGGYRSLVYDGTAKAFVFQMNRTDKEEVLLE